jgi:hypothetical protein
MKVTKEQTKWCSKPIICEAEPRVLNYSIHHETGHDARAIVSPLSSARGAGPGGPTYMASMMELSVALGRIAFSAKAGSGKK